MERRGGTRDTQQTTQVLTTVLPEKEKIAERRSAAIYFISIQARVPALASASLTLSYLLISTLAVIPSHPAQHLGISNDPSSVTTTQSLHGPDLALRTPNP